MPPPPKNSDKKKKKGHAPAHQNKFAWTHNPKSKTTERILKSPNVHVCRRCHDKIEWRKQYRKYKPRTQPGMCNGCKKRNVLAAYHTICLKCTTESVQAKKVIREATSIEPAGVESPDIIKKDEVQFLRACAGCVKEIALHGSKKERKDNDSEEIDDATNQMKLREKRTLERKIAKQEVEEKKAAAEKKRKDNQTQSEDEDDNYIHNSTEAVPVVQPLHDGLLSTLNELVVKGNDFEDEEEDPFLKAIGGSILTGEEYQKKLLQQKK